MDELFEDNDFEECVMINLCNSGVTPGNPLSNDLDCCIGNIRVILHGIFLIQVDMKEIEDDPVHCRPQPIAEPPDARHHALHQPLLVGVRVHRHEGRDGWVGDGADTGQNPGTPHHPGLGTKAVPDEKLSVSDYLYVWVLGAIFFS